MGDADWRSRLGGARDVVGRDITVDGVRLTSPGVGQRGFEGEVVERPTEIWMPIDMQPWGLRRDRRRCK
jgi:hypothetical protein